MSLFPGDKVLYTLLLSFTILWGGCAETEKTEAVTAEITAAQIEGRTTARNILLSQTEDSTKLLEKLLDAKSIQSKYIIDGKPECAQAFDSAFFSTIRSVRPDLYTRIKTKN